MAGVMLSVLICLFSVITSFDASGASTCSDDPVFNCTDVLRVRPDLCNITCLAIHCRHSCGRCTTVAAPNQLECYNCYDIDRPSQCHSLQTCNQSQSCIVTQSINTNLEEKFQMGCVDDQICEDLYSTPAAQQGKRSIVYHGHCCKQSRCNNREPELSHARSDRTTAASQGCSDVDPDICRYAHNHNLCKNACIAEHLCPHTCQKCLRCRKCEFVAKPSDCANIENCMPGELCIVSETVSPTYHYGYRLGCASRAQCNPFLNLIAASNGKRDISDGYCCGHDLCNHRNTVTSTSHQCTPHISSNDQCPQHFVHVPLTSSCYYFHHQKLKQSAAHDLCTKICTRLVILSTSEERRALTSFIQHNLISTLHLQMNQFDSTFWTDGVKDGQGQTNDYKWVWNSTGHAINSQRDIHWKPNTPDGHKYPGGEHCLDFGPYEGVNQQEYFSDDRNCDMAFYPLCEYNPSETH